MNPELLQLFSKDDLEIQCIHYQKTSIYFGVSQTSSRLSTIFNDDFFLMIVIKNEISSRISKGNLFTGFNPLMPKSTFVPVYN